MNKEVSQVVRTRFAPSPTGFLHVGGVRTAIFAFLLAEQAGEKGSFILRIEDTDQKREVEGSEQHIIESLEALGLQYDEGPDIGGPYGPYRQSERTSANTYNDYAKKLVAQGRAYADPYSKEELNSFREQAKEAKKPFLYRNHRPENPPVWDGSQPLRFKSDPKDYKWNDLIMGEISTGPEVIDDFILVKSDGFPTYNFAHIVDDLEMEITHVIRGQEFISSTPNFLNLYEALGVDRPHLASAPHILAAEGDKKLSKRDDAKDVLDYIAEGYLPDALVNFMASLGWNDGSDEEIFTKQQLAEKFDLSRVKRSSARFDERRLKWMNGTYIREKMSLEDLYDYSTGKNFLGKNYWPPEAKERDEAYQRSVLNLYHDRLKYFDELPKLTEFFFKDLPLNPELISKDKKLKKFTPEELRSLLQTAETSLQESDFAVEDLRDRLNKLLETTGQKPFVLFNLVRIATTQAAASPELPDTLNLLGKELSLKRISQQLEAL